jgi:hypothetical protein
MVIRTTMPTADSKMITEYHNQNDCRVACDASSRFGTSLRVKPRFRCLPANPQPCLPNSHHHKNIDRRNLEEEEAACSTICHNLLRRIRIRNRVADAPDMSLVRWVQSTVERLRAVRLAIKEEEVLYCHSSIAPPQLSFGRPTAKQE